MSSNSPLVLVLLAVAAHAVAAFPPNISRGTYHYDPDSIPQNEQILKLFLHLAAHTANRLIHLKNEARLHPKLAHKINGTFDQKIPSRINETNESVLDSGSAGEEGNITHDRTVGSERNELKIGTTEEPRNLLSNKSIFQRQDEGKPEIIDGEIQSENFVSTTEASPVADQAILSNTPGNSRPPEVEENVSDSSRNSVQQELPSVPENSSVDLREKKGFFQPETSSGLGSPLISQPREIVNSVSSILKPFTTNSKKTEEKAETVKSSDSEVEIANRLFSNDDGLEPKNSGISLKINQAIPSTIRPVDLIIRQIPGTNVLRNNIPKLDSVISGTDDLTSSVVHPVRNNSLVNNIPEVEKNVEEKLPTEVRRILSPLKSTVEEIPNAAGNVAFKTLDKPEGIVPLFRAFPEIEEKDNGNEAEDNINSFKNNVTLQNTAELEMKPRESFTVEEKNTTPAIREKYFVEKSAVELEESFPLYGQINSDDDINGNISEATLKEIFNRLLAVLQSVDRK